MSISQVLLTHWHSDHIGGVSALLAQYPHLREEVYKADPDQGQNSIRDGQLFTAEGATIRALFTPGHSLDHMCFVLQETNTMFTGDNVLGHGNSVVVENLGLYVTSLGVMRKEAQAAGIAIAYPGHGAMIEDLPSKLTVYTRHWETQEKFVISAFAGANANVRSLTTRQIIADLYGADSYAMVGPIIAEVLSKLSDEGKVGFTVLGQEKKWFLRMMK